VKPQSGFGAADGRLTLLKVCTGVHRSYCNPPSTRNPKRKSTMALGDAGPEAAFVTSG